jgi:hypothetical protein
MGSRKGIPNKDKAAVRDLAAQHGVDVIEMRTLLLKDCWKSIQLEIGKPRSRRSKRYLQAEEMANKHLTELTPYLHGKLSNIQLEGEITHIPTVIRAPATIANSQAWLTAYGPRRDGPVNDIPFAKSLKTSLDTADSLGITDPKTIVQQAQQSTDDDDDDDLVKRWDKKYLRGIDDH